MISWKIRDGRSQPRPRTSNTRTAAHRIFLEFHHFLSKAMETNISNWREPDHSQWAFQNVDKLINVHQIRKGSNVSALESNLKVFDGFKINTPDGSALSIDDFLKATETDGFVLLQRGKIVYEKYDRTNSRESKHIMMSMSKSVTGLIAGMLASQGRLEVNALVTRYVPEVKDTPFAKVTVQQCLDMRSGVKVCEPTMLPWTSD